MPENTELAEYAEARRVRARVIADHYSVTERCVLTWKDQGRIPHIKIGKCVRFDFAAVIEAIEGKAAAR